jgi:hypothetical protein
MAKKSCGCGKMAVWLYGPDGTARCDDCVPRGCSCNRELKEGIDYESPEAELPENWIELTDVRGRKYPCCEWLWDADGFESEDSVSDALQCLFQKAQAEGRAVSEKVSKQAKSPLTEI